MPVFGTADLAPWSGKGAGSKTFSFEGAMYRAVDAEPGTKVGLGPATYLSDRQRVAEDYGSEVHKFQVSLDRVVGTNSREYESLRSRAMHLWNTNDEMVRQYDHPIYVVNKLARNAGYDAIWGGSVYGMAVFDRKSIKDLGLVSK